MLCTGTGAGDEEMTERGGPSPRRADRPERVAAGPRGHAARTPQASATRGASARPRPPPRRAPTSQHGQRGHTPPPGHSQRRLAPTVSAAAPRLPDTSGSRAGTSPPRSTSVLDRGPGLAHLPCVCGFAHVPSPLSSREIPFSVTVLFCGFKWPVVEWLQRMEF